MNSCSENWPFLSNSSVIGMPLPKYLDWAAGTDAYPKKLLLPPIQRGFVWKPVQIAQLWDSLLRGMPIGSLMVSQLAKDELATGVGSKGRVVQIVENQAVGLLDGQQRTLAMLLGWKNQESDTWENDHCVWIDLEEKGGNGSPFELRISTRTQPFGYQRHQHGKLSRHDRRNAREAYDKLYIEHKDKRDYELFRYGKVQPWKNGKSTALCFPVRELWEVFRRDENSGITQYIESTTNDNIVLNETIKSNLIELQIAFNRLNNIEVPLILIPKHISQPQKDSILAQADAPAPLTILFERIGRNGASLSSEDLLFSMIKQQWPEAHDLVEGIHRDSKVGNLMSATDYVMTAYRLAAAELGLADSPRPRTQDFHRHLGSLIGDGAPLRCYLRYGKLTSAFNSLYEVLEYRGGEDIGLPTLMMPHLSRGLIHVLLRWFMLNDPDASTMARNRSSIIAFALFWYLCIWNEDKASKKSFERMNAGDFPGTELYRELSEVLPGGETGLALPLVSPERLQEILLVHSSALLRASEEIFARDSTAKFVSSVQERDLYKRFCWWRRPVLLWLQREYIQKTFAHDFFGITDEDSVPYDYDHLCPQNHWGTDWRNISRNSTSLSNDLMNNFYRGRGDVGNCIGNLHVLDSSLNRSFGDDPLELKLNQSAGWSANDSLLYLVPGHEELWKIASPMVNGENARWEWNEDRLRAFQDATCNRALKLYFRYYSVCMCLVTNQIQDVSN